MLSYFILANTENFTKSNNEKSRTIKADKISSLGPRGLHETITYQPPLSPYNLIQEQLYQKPWQLLVATIFLNKTTGTAAIPVFWQFMKLYGTPQKTIKAGWKPIAGSFLFFLLFQRRYFSTDKTNERNDLSCQ